MWTPEKWIWQLTIFWLSVWLLSLQLISLDHQLNSSPPKSNELYPICHYYEGILIWYVKITWLGKISSSFVARARVYGSYARVRARIFTKRNLVIKSYLMNLSVKFRKDPSFRWGDIPLFVTVYDLELKISFSIFKPPKKRNFDC